MTEGRSGAAHLATWLLVAATVGSGLQAGCSMQDCSGFAYGASFPLPTAVDALDCTLTLYGPTGSVLTYDVPSPGPGTGIDNPSSCAAATPGAYVVPCNRQPSTGGLPQTVGIEVGPVTSDVAAFEQAVGGTTFQVSLSCGGISVLDHDPQSVTHYCED